MRTTRSLFGTLTAALRRSRGDLAAKEQTGRASWTEIWTSDRRCDCLSSPVLHLTRSNSYLTANNGPSRHCRAACSRSFASQAAQSTKRPSDVSKPEARPGRQAASPGADAPSEASQFSRNRKRGSSFQTLPPGTAQQTQLKMALVSPNMLAEPYTGEPEALTWLSFLTISGWRERWQRTLSGAKSIYTLSKCKKYLKPFHVDRFKAEALSLYERACTQIARGDAGALRQLATPTEHSLMKQQIKSREDGGWARTVWALAERPALSDLELVRGRLVIIDPKDETSGFAQLTLRIRSRHNLRIKDPVSCWRVAGRLSLPPQDPAQRGLLFRAFQAVFVRRKR
ncbi:hypothetical protein WJX73_002111 [Symbiochloris irregularis]|uniref:Tim44-like domain-containing protein n=1 Tax=Symbiochloris irregularis TaxID=706552 RepID=A0AAW1NWR6_9CHLO